MKMHAIIDKQGFAVIIVFCYICLFGNPVITILKVVGCEDCVQEKSIITDYLLWGLEGKALSRWAIFAIFRKK